MKPGNSILSGYGTTIFEVMSRLASHHGAINLGQGFPEGLESERLLGVGFSVDDRRAAAICADDGRAGVAPGHRHPCQAVL